MVVVLKITIMVSPRARFFEGLIKSKSCDDSTAAYCFFFSEVSFFVSKGLQYMFGTKYLKMDQVKFFEDNL